MTIAYAEPVVAERRSRLRSDIALAARVEKLEEQLGGQAQPADQFTAEAAEREAYRTKLERMRQYVSMGEGI